MTEPFDDGLTESYRAAYERMLRDVSATKGRRQPLCAFWPMRGAAYQAGEGLMVVGRAVSGWEKDTRLTLEDLQTETGIRARAQAARDLNRKMGLDWVLDARGERKDGDTRLYNTNRSPFWGLARRLEQHLGVNRPDPDLWANRICWSNLYKVAPFSTGNPGSRLSTSQQRGCIELLQLEVAAWRPRYVLVVAGTSWWHPFGQTIAGNELVGAGKYVEQAFESNGTRWIVTCRPERQLMEPFVDEVMRAITA